TYQHAFGKNLVSFEQRVEMCQLATRGLDSVMISQIERELGGESRTYDTVLALRERHPDCDFSLIVGTDILGETHKWKNWDGLMEMVELVVVGRGGFLEDKTDSQTPSFSLPQVSSTAVRRALAAGQRDGILRDWMVLEVLEFIDAHGLYGGEEEPA
ncbi:MAG: nicotinate-nicotinamide nucleotide adenylyltransferase, partial [Myxococcota bacterium]|nr:nicotinate-nicotinamide nucleotide adenylyltransferase [Myxococcota bacterium]